MGLACLRAALVKFRGSNPMMPPIDSLMDPNIYSYFSAGACTSEEVVEKTRVRRCVIFSDSDPNIHIQDHHHPLSRLSPLSI